MGTERRSRRLLKRLARSAFFWIGVIMLIRWTGWLESKALYFPRRDAFQTPASFEDVQIPVGDAFIHAWFMPARNVPPGARSPAILHCHGNAGCVEDHLDHSLFLTAHGFHVLLFDPRGYGRSDAARPTRKTYKADALAAFDALAARPDVDPSRLGVYGVSLGGTFALAVANERPNVCAVCTVSAFASWRRVADDHAPFLGPLLVPAGIDAEDLAHGLGDRAWMIVHGDQDQTVPVHHGARLFRVAQELGISCEYLPVHGGDHNGVVDTQPVRDAIASFFARQLGQ